jgi:hypothetical protein
VRGRRSRALEALIGERLRVIAGKTVLSEQSSREGDAATKRGPERIIRGLWAARGVTAPARGWQEQTNAHGRGELKVAIGASPGRGDLGGSGQTDAGVHAAAQTRTCGSRARWTGEPAAPSTTAPSTSTCSPRRSPRALHARHAAVSAASTRSRPAGPRSSFVWWIKRPLDAGGWLTAARLPGGTTSRSSAKDRGPDEHARRRRAPRSPAED